ncbi:ABC transporter permease [Mucilaginibacter terrae]|uniref:ABC transport system permease protein n=1 Tax=Mucilaginibacter terrae TaxID=1955052 RepID=A0ABU3GPF1_9SPHI|nr:ABC transporter permease [Mucilaginibacter terrae]MDT3401659.1 putative ABC transport system permease protein [Mucilaginibacter terrae]
MIKNYIKTAWRNLWKGRVFNFMNLLGLSVAVACCALIFMTVFYEFSYDQFHANIDKIQQIYSVTNRVTGTEKSTAMPVPLAPALKSEYGDIKYITRSANGAALIKYGNKELEKDVHYVDADFLRMFTFPLLQGNVNSVFNGLNNVVITESTAKALFGNEPALNKTILFTLGEEQVPFQVSGVLKDIPGNSSIYFDVLVRFEHFPNYKSGINKWDNWSHLAFVQFKDGYNANTFPKQLKPFVEAHYKGDIDLLKRDGAKPDENGSLLSLHVTPFAGTHFSNGFSSVEGNPVSKIYVLSLLAIACFILIIACINFINLSVARGFTRAREVGVRKTLGAGKWQLLTQFWTETVMVCLASTFIGLALCALIISPFKAMFKSRITLSMLFEPMHLLGILVVFLLITALAGFYPALMMMRYKTVAVLKGNMGNTAKPGKLRNTLLVVQFTLSTLLIICTIVTWQQINYLSNKPLGYNKAEVLSIPVSRGLNGDKTLQIMRNELRNNNQVVAVTGSFMNMGMGNDGSSRFSVLGFDMDGKEIRTNVHRVNYDYVKTLDLKLVDGRDFSSQFPGDSTAVVINEAMARSLGGKNLIGKFIPMYPEYKSQVIGIVKDYNFKSLHDKIEPVSLLMRKEYEVNYVFVKVKPGSLLHAYDQIKQSWKRQFPTAEFTGSWLNENTERQYQNERRLSNIFVSGAILAIVISCIGLLAISIMIVIQRTKEIGIRKVLGANVSGIVLLLSRDFIKLVLLAAVIAVPVSWWLMDNWLQGFAYRITIQWWVFVLATLMAILLAFITISFQSVKAALANPVKSLRSE